MQIHVKIGDRPCILYILYIVYHIMNINSLDITGSDILPFGYSVFHSVFSMCFSPMRHSLFYFSDARKFCHAHGLRHLTRDVTGDVGILNLRSDVSCTTTINTE